MQTIAIKSTEYTEITTTNPTAFTIQNTGTDKIFVYATNTHVTPTSGGYERLPNQSIVIQKSDYAYVYVKSSNYSGKIEVGE